MALRLGERWRSLPRDSRDTLFLLGVIAWTVLPHVSHLPLWCTLLTAVMLLWRTQLAVVNGPLPTRWWLAILLVIAAGLTLWTYRTLLGKEPGVTMAVALMALKTLELRARRDAFVVFFLGFFIILTHFLYSQSLLVAAMMLVSVWGLLTALVLAHMPVGQPGLRQAGSLAARTALLGAPIMALLFVLFPRLGPLWGLPQDGAPSMGLSNSMRMGSVAEIAQDDRVALRVRFADRVPPQSAMYFRGPVLTLFDGREWRPERAGFARSTAELDLRVRGEPIRYEMTLEPQRLNVVPLLEAAPRAPALEGQRVALREDMQWVTDRPLLERLRFEATAYTDFRHGASPADASLREALWLPPGHNPRTIAWAAALRNQPRLARADAGALSQAVLAHIRTGGYSYTLAPGTYGETSPFGAIDEFWLDRKLGFCEHFAAGFVVAMRAMGVPARIVTGYQGTDALPVDGYYVVRQSAAHAWAEYWQPAVGWVRADPTAAVAPERVMRSRHLLPPPGLVAGTLGTVNPELLAQLRSGWEALDNRWNQWVLNYSRGQQLDLLRRVGFRAPTWEDLSLLLIGALSALALAGATWAWWDRRRVDPWVRQMDAVRAALHRLHVDAAAHEPPRTLAHRVRERLGTAGGALAELLETIDRQRYGRQSVARPDGALTRRFRAAARELRRRRAAASPS
ncbi:MAG TPA: transglutaminaseTgpA domain-containing protein [Albitalea sp.]